MTFSWTHDGTNINRAHSSVTHGATSTLTIINVSYSSSGSYVCTAMRGSLSVTSNAAAITVYGKVKYSYVNYLIIINYIILLLVLPNPLFYNNDY